MKIWNLIDFKEDISDAIEAFSVESDRGIILLSTSLIDDTLGEIIRKKLISSAKKHDELFENLHAPLKYFSARIDFAYRIGLINHNTHSAFHQIREIRNEFAHGFLPVSFDDQKVFDKISNILSSYYNYLKEIISHTLTNNNLLNEIELIQNCNNHNQTIKEILKLIGPRNTYEIICAFVYACLKDKQQDITQLNIDNEDSVL